MTRAGDADGKGSVPDSGAAPDARFTTHGVYAEGTYRHRNRLIRYSHDRRFARALRLLDVRPGQRVLDFGSGDGHLLERLHAQVPGAELVAYEPLESLCGPLLERFRGLPVRVVARRAELGDVRFERIACLEVLEHLPQEQLDETLATLATLLAPGGVLVVSVPLEVGPSVLAKYLTARLVMGSTRHYRPGEILRATLGLQVTRGGEGAFLPHRGFDYRVLRAALVDRFELEHQSFSPLPLLGPVLNAQIFWRLTARATPA